MISDTLKLKEREIHESSVREEALMVSEGATLLRAETAEACLEETKANLGVSSTSLANMSDNLKLKEREIHESSVREEALMASEGVTLLRAETAVRKDSDH
ncbi:unnamed protein product [Choristocarpus tenellus]